MTAFANCQDGTRAMFFDLNFKMAFTMYVICGYIFQIVRMKFEKNAKFNKLTLQPFYIIVVMLLILLAYYMGLAMLTAR